MAFPTILFNSATGSDSLASGAGPGTALTGTSASTNGAGTTVTLDGSPDLTNVATDGTHVIYLADATAGNRNFAKITSKDNGAKTVGVANAFGISLSGKSWAIGGKRASIGGTNSKKLLNNNSAAGDALPGWILEMQSGHSESIGAQLDVYSFGDTTDGPLIVRGTPGAGTRPLLTFTTSGSGFAHAGVSHYVHYMNFNIAATGASDIRAFKFDSIPTYYNKVQNIKVVKTDGSNWWYKGVDCGMRTTVVNCDFECGNYCVGAGNGFQGPVMYANIFRGAGTSIEGGHRGLCIMHNIYKAAGIGLDSAEGIHFIIAYNTIDSAPSHSISIAGSYDAPYGIIVNNIITNGGAYGINFTTDTANEVLADGFVFAGNNLYNNTSGDCNLSGVIVNNPNLDPEYADTGTDDYTPTNTSLAGTAFPSVIGLTS